MYGLGFLAVILLPLLTSAVPAPTGDEPVTYCGTITTKAGYPDTDPNEYFKVSCYTRGGAFHQTEKDYFNAVWRAECHDAFLDVPESLHETPLGVINIDYKVGADACV